MSRRRREYRVAVVGRMHGPKRPRSPSLAMMASRLHSALLSLASVAHQRDGGRGHGAGWPLKRIAQSSAGHFAGQQPAEFRACS